TGSQVWTARYHGPAVQGEDYGFRLALDGSGDVYVLDQSVSGSSLIKYHGNGDQLWATNFSGVGSGNFLPNVLGLDGAGNPYLAGAFFASGGRTDIATAKFQPNGNQLWAAHHNGVGTNDAFFSAMTVDNVGNVYVTGWSAAPGTSYDFVTV